MTLNVLEGLGLFFKVLLPGLLIVSLIYTAAQAHGAGSTFYERTPTVHVHTIP